MGTIHAAGGETSKDRILRHIRTHDSRVEYHFERKLVASLALAILTVLAIVGRFLEGLPLFYLVALTLGAGIGYCAHSIKIHAAKIKFHADLAEQWKWGD